MKNKIIHMPLKLRSGKLSRKTTFCGIKTKSAISEELMKCTCKRCIRIFDNYISAIFDAIKYR